MTDRWSHIVSRDVSGFHFTKCRYCTVIKIVLIVSSKAFLGFRSFIQFFSLDNTKITGSSPERSNFQALTCLRFSETLYQWSQAGTSVSASYQESRIYSTETVTRQTK
ncbi:Uncharacterized protein Fot_48820 [Forsythia ovata]|uniref:Uncharacterized protein n=1 Tax=Forsythia ovata TaxID=205694 RepID=A0ABD1QB35_9LAMI